MDFGLLGRSLGHSYSPRLHKALGSYDYGLFELEPEAVESFLKKGDFRGINVTIPYKETVMPHCQSLSPAAREIGSVNLILKRADGSLYGDNTDACGFQMMLEGSGISVAGKKVLVLGSGGASRTVCHVLREKSAGQVLVISRSGADNYENLERHKNAEILVNTTPLGMYPHTEAAPLSLAQFPSCQGVLDLVYNPARTQLLQEAERRGIPHVGGLSMLVYQARAAAERFLNRGISEEKTGEVLHTLQAEMENIILIGMPGCGKSVLGRVLAKSLKRDFIDADQVIAAKAGRTIPEVFQQEGESGFRSRETAALTEIGRQSGKVIATGGGCVTREENYFHLHQNGFIILLERPLQDLATKGRPLSQNDSLGELYKTRLPLYRQFADCAVENAGSIGEAARRIKEAVHAHFRHQRP